MQENKAKTYSQSIPQDSGAWSLGVMRSNTLFLYVYVHAWAHTEHTHITYCTDMHVFLFYAVKVLNRIPIKKMIPVSKLKNYSINYHIPSKFICCLRLISHFSKKIEGNFTFHNIRTYKYAHGQVGKKMLA